MVYATVTLYLIWENQRNGRNDKFPCVIVKARAREELNVEPEKPWSIRLINVGRGPAFIKKFTVCGLTSYNGDCTHLIDKVIGPDVGDPHLQIEFTFEKDLGILRESRVTIEIQYEDIAGRPFRSGIEKGIPFWKPPRDFKESLLWRLINYVRGKKEDEDVRS